MERELGSTAGQDYDVVLEFLVHEWYWLNGTDPFNIPTYSTLNDGWMDPIYVQRRSSVPFTTDRNVYVRFLYVYVLFYRLLLRLTSPVSSGTFPSLLLSKPLILSTVFFYVTPLPQPRFKVLSYYSFSNFGRECTQDRQ